jgi:hypothetical protein
MGRVEDALDPWHSLEVFVSTMAGGPHLGVIIEGPDRRDHAVFLDVQGCARLRALLDCAAVMMQQEAGSKEPGDATLRHAVPESAPA